MPADKVGWVTPQLSAARLKLRSRANAIKNSSLSITVARLLPTARRAAFRRANAVIKAAWLQARDLAEVCAPVVWSNCSESSPDGGGIGRNGCHELIAAPEQGRKTAFSMLWRQLRGAPRNHPPCPAEQELLIVRGYRNLAARRRLRERIVKFRRAER